MSTYVLIHGSWHGAWCWYKIMPLLQQAGHQVIALDLPGHGRDWTAPREVSLQRYVESVCNVLDAQAASVILVGHSRGGIVISQTAEHRSDKIRTLVYLAAFLIPNGETLMTTALRDPDSLIISNTVSEEHFGRIPRVYIETLQDKGVTPALQKKMYTVTPCQQIISMHTSHSPFLSQSQQLASHLTSLSL